LSNTSSLPQVPTAIKLELYGLFKFVTVSHSPNTSKPGIFGFTERAKWDSWQEVGANYSAQSDPDGAAEARYMDIAKSLGWKSGVTPNDDLPDGEGESTKTVTGGMGVFVSTMSAPKDDDSNTLHGLAIAGDSQKLAKMLIAEPSLDLNQKDEYGYTALHLACDRGNLAVVELLLKHGVNRTLKDPDELTALELAETCGHDEIVKVLKDGQ